MRLDRYRIITNNKIEKAIFTYLFNELSR
jgi:hypothetical protein